MTIGRKLAQSYIDDPRHMIDRLVRPTARDIMDDHFQRAHDDAVQLARDCFLNMIADADRFEEDVDGDCVDGQSVMYINYDLRVGHSQLQELCEVLGIKAHGYDETLKEAIDKAIAN